MPHLRFPDDHKCNKLVAVGLWRLMSALYRLSMGMSTQKTRSCEPGVGHHTTRYVSLLWAVFLHFSTAFPSITEPLSVLFHEALECRQDRAHEFWTMILSLSLMSWTSFAILRDSASVTILW